MGEPRGRLELLIAELEAKRDEALRALEEYEVLLPHLQAGLNKLDTAGFTEAVGGDGGAQPAPKPRRASAPEPVEAEEEEVEEVEAAAEVEGPEEEEEAEEPKKKPGPARRSIASLVAEDDEKKAASA